MFSSRPEIDWSELFGNSRPVEVEIGSGKGAFLLAAASEHPETNFLGLENQPRWARWIEQRLSQLALDNARIVRADAALVLGRFVRDDSVRAHHIYFPDPWWKRRHHRRRIVRPEFAASLWRTLEPGGVLYLATDVEERFRAMLDDLGTAPFTIRLGVVAPGRPLTNFERKYRREGRSLHYAALEKLSPTAVTLADQPPARGGKTSNF